MNSTLLSTEVERFVQEGCVRVEAAFSLSTAARCRDWLWREIGLDPAAPEAWAEPVVRVSSSTAKPFLEAANTPRLHSALDQLVGKGRWRRPIRGLGTFPIRFPSLRDPGDAGWHVDGSYSVGNTLYLNIRSRGRALLMLFLFSDVSELDAPTQFRVGSHLAVPRSLISAGEVGRAFYEVLDSIPEVDDLPIGHATGRAGDIYLCHPFLVHSATWPHRGTQPRFMAQPGLEPTEPLALFRESGDYSPVERAILLGMQNARGAPAA